MGGILPGLKKMLRAAMKTNRCWQSDAPGHLISLCNRNHSLDSLPRRSRNSRLWLSRSSRATYSTPFPNPNHGTDRTYTRYPPFSAGCSVHIYHINPPSACQRSMHVSVDWREATVSIASPCHRQIYLPCRDHTLVPTHSSPSRQTST